MKFIRNATYAALGLALLAGPAFAEENDLDFKLHNATGYDIGAVYVTPVSVNSWSEDIMGGEQLASDETADVTFTGDKSECKFDMRVDWTDDSKPVVWKGLDLCEISEVTLKYDRDTDITTAQTK